MSVVYPPSQSDLPGQVFCQLVQIDHQKKSKLPISLLLGSWPAYPQVTAMCLPTALVTIRHRIELTPTLSSIPLNGSGEETILPEGLMLCRHDSFHVRGMHHGCWRCIGCSGCFELIARPLGEVKLQEWIKYSQKKVCQVSARGSATQLRSSLGGPAQPKKHCPWPELSLLCLLSCTMLTIRQRKSVNPSPTQPGTTASRSLQASHWQSLSEASKMLPSTLGIVRSVQASRQNGSP